MSISFLCCTISEIDNDTVLRASLLEAIGIARALRHLCGKGRGNELEAVLWRAIVDWHLAAMGQVVTVVEALMDHPL
jgi:hypothetical protein